MYILHASRGSVLLQVSAGTLEQQSQPLYIKRYHAPAGSSNSRNFATISAVPLGAHLMPALKEAQVKGLATKDRIQLGFFIDSLTVRFQHTLKKLPNSQRW